MSCRGRIKKKASLICVGSLNERIKIIDRAITPATISHTMDLSDYKTAWASVESRSGTPRFDGVNIDRQSATTVFYIRSGYDIEKKQLIEFNGRYFEVGAIENMNEENRFLALYCVETGNIKDSDGFTDLGANLSL